MYRANEIMSEFFVKIFFLRWQMIFVQENARKRRKMASCVHQNSVVLESSTIAVRCRPLQTWLSAKKPSKSSYCEPRTRLAPFWVLISTIKYIYILLYSLWIKGCSVLRFYCFTVRRKCELKWKTKLKLRKGQKL